MSVKQILAKAFRIPRRLRMIFYIRYNRFIFMLNGASVGKNMKVHNQFYLLKHKDAKLTIGDNLVFTSGEAFNP